jgi:hypothetical protein
MFKKIGIALVASLVSLFGAVNIAQPAQASGTTVHGCNTGSVCVYWDSNYGTPIAAQTTAAIFHAANDCWQFNATWSNKTSSWYANFELFNGQTAELYFYDNTTCTGSSVYEGQAPQGQASMGIYNDWTGSIKLVQP